MGMDEEIFEYHKASQKEWELLSDSFEKMSEGKDSEIDSDEWPKPSSTELWSNGLKKYGISWAEREYQIHEENIEEK